jgi:alpha-beta hydrolase superfamily lysophospholipase
MKSTYLNPVVVLLLTLFSMPNVFSQDSFKLVQFKTEDEGNIEAALFETGKDKVVIFAHGAIFNKESWYFMAEKFMEINISSLCIDFRGYGNSKVGKTDQKYWDILSAVAFLKEKGYREIDIVGGSMGGAAVLTALEQSTDPLIAKMVLLAPAGGPPISANNIQKLFIVSKEEGLYNRVKTIYNHSSDPKSIKEFEGNAHAQHLFKSPYENELIDLIIRFIDS